ncbi:hypothetical protein L917_00640 [Phytophthora nicotianae]|uniref:HIT domain-containing protein n=3 Tax=Phytophthora nicotianae TaxID=4792 RepID=W2PC59_PHYN3|nr:hypothetical protein PPTG_24620 [Phytophthora nicotianae INRA-310]ETI53645.1 hypothetical protein F443_03443 [Phytophthora nicotianae P1569]ETM03106.1 hypothetical protein L917_00640 [Phytophthora nicotianae]ETM98421.1 hypothetical protein PPTG_24620 [Phytophthora nicotianae INRA-310]
MILRTRLQRKEIHLCEHAHVQPHHVLVWPVGTELLVYVDD